MNKIVVVGDILEKASVCNKINVEFYKKEGLFAINEIKISVERDSNLEMEIILEEESKLNIEVDIYNNVKLNLNILIKGNKGKVQYKYNLNSNSSCNVFKFNDVNSIKEMVITKLMGENASFEYNFKTIANNKETYDYHIFHNNKNTVSNIKNNGVCIEDGTMICQVSSFVPKESVNCIVNQSNRIINLTDNRCEIMPNLYIDCNDVSASHSALIGKFSDEEMFYIQSRGISYDKALKLLIAGFLTSDINNKKMLKGINKNIEKYWR